jgi:tetratricopeptide (TPR) repeat protein
MSGSTTTASRRRAAILLIAAIASSSTVSTRARGEQPADDARAIELYEESLLHYREGRFKEAAELLRELYRAKPEPVLLYNLGRACEGMGDLACAIDAYTRYLRDDLVAKDRGAIERRVQTLRRQLEERQTLERQRDLARGAARTPGRASEGTPRAPSSASALPWFVAGLGVAGLGSGIVLGILAQGKHSDAVDEPVQQTAAAKQAEAEDLATAANIAFVSGGLIAGAGFVWGIRDVGASQTRPSSSRASVELRLGLTGASVLGRF